MSAVPAGTLRTGSLEGESEAADWAVQWLPEGGELVTESYVNLIPTSQGGTHVNGFRTGLLEAMREFCEFRSLLPRGVKLSPEDIWDRCAYILVGKNGRPAIFRANQGAPVIPAVRTLCVRYSERRL